MPALCVWGEGDVEEGGQTDRPADSGTSYSTRGVSSPPEVACPGGGSGFPESKPGECMGKEAALFPG